MAHMKSLILGLSLIVTGVLFSAQAAEAQATKVITVDTQRVISESAGGQDMARKIEAIGQTIQGELQAEQQALSTEGSAIQSRLATMTPEAIQADAALNTQFQAFQRKQQALAQKTALRQEELKQTSARAFREFEQALSPVIIQVAAERGAQMVMDASSTIYSDPSLDATDLVISKINATTPTVNVVRARLQAPQAAPETIQ